MVPNHILTLDKDTAQAQVLQSRPNHVQSNKGNPVNKSSQHLLVKRTNTPHNVYIYIYKSSIYIYYYIHSYIGA